MDFFKTLIRPDHEKYPERAQVGRAANLLQVGEFQFLQLAYREWFGHDMPTAMFNRLFDSYMLGDGVPYWVVVDVRSRVSYRSLLWPSTKLPPPGNPLSGPAQADEQGDDGDHREPFAEQADRPGGE